MATTFFLDDSETYKTWDVYLDRWSRRIYEILNRSTINNRTGELHLISLIEFQFFLHLRVIEIFVSGFRLNYFYFVRGWWESIAIHRFYLRIATRNIGYPRNIDRFVYSRNVNVYSRVLVILNRTNISEQYCLQLSNWFDRFKLYHSILYWKNRGM